MFGFSLILQKWPRALHFNFWVRAQRKTAQNGPKSAFFKYLLISHPKVVSAWNKCPFHHFRGMLAWKSGLSFWIATLKVPFLGTPIWALLAKIAESAHIQVPKNGALSVGIQKLRPLFHANIPPNSWRGVCFMCLSLLEKWWPNNLGTSHSLVNWGFLYIISNYGMLPTYLGDNMN